MTSAEREACDRARHALELIRAWCNAYNAEIFGEDADLDAAAAAIGPNELSRIHATWARRLLEGIGTIAAGGLADNGDRDGEPAPGP